MEQTIDQIKEISLSLIKEYVAPPNKDVTLDTTLTSLGADSLDRIEVFMAFEETFKNEFPNEECLPLDTPRAIIEYIAKKKGITVGDSLI